MRTFEVQRSSGSAAGCRALAAPAVAIAMALLAFPALANAASPPSIDSESVAELTSRHATLVAQINPSGLETTFEFWVQYAVCQGPQAGGVDCFAISIVKRGEGTIKAGSTDQYVSTTLKHLQPGYSYTYWVVATNAAGETKVHQEFKTLPLPVIAGESVSGVTGSDAKLEAQINPEGQNVRYQFQLAGDPSEYASEIECPEPSPGPLACVGTHVKGALPIGFVWGNLANPLAAQPASLDLESAGVKLKPDTTYHYRVIAAPSEPSEDTIEWEGPPVYGADQTFTTSSAPSIESESVSHLTSTDATLEAQINTEGLETTYAFHMIGAFCEWPCESPEYLFTLPSGKLLGSYIGQGISLDLNSAGVSPMPINTYWVTATNSAGTTTGPSHTFRSGEQGVQPLTTVKPSGGGSSSGSGSQAAGSSGSQPMTSTGAPSQPRPHAGATKRHRKHKHRAKHKHHALKIVRHARHEA
jgi:hypothetical protein